MNTFYLSCVTGRLWILFDLLVLAPQRFQTCQHKKRNRLSGQFSLILIYLSAPYFKKGVQLHATQQFKRIHIISQVQSTNKWPHAKWILTVHIMMKCASAVQWSTGCRLSSWSVPVQWLTGCRLSSWSVLVQWLTGCRLSSWGVPVQWLTGCRLSQWTRETCFRGSGLQVCTAMVEIPKKLKAVHCDAVQYACRPKKPCFARTQNMWLTWQYKPLLSWPTHCASCEMGSKFPLRIFKENLETTGIFFYYFIIVHRFQIWPQVINWIDLFEKKSFKISG